MDNVTEFIYKHEGVQRELMINLHSFMMNLPEIRCKISYHLPFYYRQSWICYLNPLKDGRVEFAFTWGNELSNESGLLESKGRKQVYSVTISSIKDVGSEELNQVIQEAILLDEMVPYASKR